MQQLYDHNGDTAPVRTDRHLAMAAEALAICMLLQSK